MQKKNHKRINLVSPKGLKIFEIKPKGRYILVMPNNLSDIENVMFVKSFMDKRKKFCPTARFLVMNGVN